MWLKYYNKIGENKTSELLIEDVLRESATKDDSLFQHAVFACPMWYVHFVGLVPLRLFCPPHFAKMFLKRLPI